MRVLDGSKSSIISIHALLAESDDASKDVIKTTSNFYPRSPCGERLHTKGNNLSYYFHFYPRSPCGERPKELALAAKNAVFLSTLSLRRATGK